jgi:hypothetical protein
MVWAGAWFAAHNRTTRVNTASNDRFIVHAFVDGRFVMGNVLGIGAIDYAIRSGRMSGNAPEGDA